MRRAALCEQPHTTAPPVAMTARSSSSEGSEQAGSDPDADVLKPRSRRAPPLTAEEKVLRRRLQYKLHQRRHRAKQKDTILTLEQEVTGLAESVARLESEWHALKSQNVFQSRGLTSGAPAKIAMEYVKIFKHGLVAPHMDMQERFVRSVMLHELSGPDYEGLDAMLDQWRLYSTFFMKTQYTPGGVRVSTTGDLTVVVVDASLSIYSRREGIECLYPNLIGKEDVIQGMLSRPLVVPGKLRFIFDEAGRISWFGTDMDFAAGLQKALGSLQLVAACMEDAQISFCTGQIKSRGHNRLPRALPVRHSLAQLSC